MRSKSTNQKTKILVNLFPFLLTSWGSLIKLRKFSIWHESCTCASRFMVKEIPNLRWRNLMEIWRQEVLHWSITYFKLAELEVLLFAKFTFCYQVWRCVNIDL